MLIATRRTMMVLVLLLSPLLVASADAATLRGQVESITITECGLKPGECEGFVLVRTDDDTRHVQVTRDTEITRAGRPILLGELGIGNVVTLQDAEPVPGTRRSVRPTRIQAP
jgi:hypothetical protein